MKRKLASIFIWILLISTMSTIGFAEEENKKPFTLMIYMVGSDLESEDGAATSDLIEMASAQFNENINVVVEAGGAKHWNLEAINSDNQTRLQLMSDDLYVMEENTKQNMGVAETLSQFVGWGIKNYPAEKYGLILWNHGGGAVTGFGVDENYGFDGLTLSELNQALDMGLQGQKMEFIGFDACLMATVETSKMMSPYANYMVASEAVEPGHGWNYTAIINALDNNPEMAGADVGKVIIDSYIEHSQMNGTESGITLSLVDLSKIDPVVSGLETLVRAMDTDMRSAYMLADFAKARYRSESYGDQGEFQGSVDHVDVWDFAYELSELYPVETKSLQDALENAVLYYVYSESKPYASGLSVYFPLKDKWNYRTNAAMYQTINFSETYEAFIDTYIEQLLHYDKGSRLEGGIAVSDSETGDVTNDYFEIQLSELEMNNVLQSYFVLSDVSDEALSIVLGVDPRVEYDYETNTIRAYYADGWETLGDQFVAMYLMNEGEGYATYTIPALLNDEEVNLIVVYDETYPDGKVVGARPIVMEAGVPDKEFYTIQNGDTITPLYWVNDAYEDTQVQGESFVVNNNLTIGWSELPVGTYAYQFYTKDIFQNVSYSEEIYVDYYEESFE